MPAREVRAVVLAHSHRRSGSQARARIARRSAALTLSFLCSVRASRRSCALRVEPCVSVLGCLAAESSSSAAVVVMRVRMLFQARVCAGLARYCPV